MAERVGRVTSAHCQRTMPGQLAPGRVCCSYCVGVARKKAERGEKANNLLLQLSSIMINSALEVTPKLVSFIINLCKLSHSKAVISFKIQSVQ